MTSRNHNQNSKSAVRSFADWPLKTLEGNAVLMPRKWTGRAPIAPARAALQSCLKNVFLECKRPESNVR